MAKVRVEMKHCVRYDVVGVTDEGEEVPLATIFDDFQIMRQVFEDITKREFDVVQDLVSELVYPRN